MWVEDFDCVVYLPKYDRNEIKARQKKAWYDKNKERLCERIACPCGGKYTPNNKGAHAKTARHIKWIASGIES